MLPRSLPEVFLDTDVAFDIISKRDPHYDSSVRLLHLAAKGSVRLIISESSLANLFYLSFDIYKIKDAAGRLSDFIGVCDIAHADKEVVAKALKSSFKDKEDALQYYTALHAEVDYFITRNKRDYKHSVPALPVYLTDEFFNIIP